MSKREFLAKLTEYLSYELPEYMVREKINFYSDYISSETGKGRSVDEVLDELGDPQLIAHSIIDAAKSGPDGIPGSDDDIDYSSEVYGNAGRGSGSSAGWGPEGGNGSAGSYGQQGQTDRSGYDPFGGNIHTYNFGCFTGILIFLIMMCVFSVIGAVLGALSPVLVPVCMVFLIMWLLNRTGGGGR
ncbi:MAG: DUF1700 domain-containing protein [Eubacteriales bacterium]|nr:DUF1700 domain-containing protein [Eubacteriales bacterium]